MWASFWKSLMSHNVREHLENIANHPGMFAYRREAIAVEVITLLNMIGISRENWMKIYLIGCPPGNIISHLDVTIQYPDDPWVQEIIAAALALLPEGSG